MNPVDTKGDPVSALQEKVDKRHVRIALGNCARMGDGMGGLFLPDTLQIVWRDRVVMFVHVSGKRLRMDGYHWIDARRCGRQYAQAPGVLDPVTPDWVHDLISRYQPE